MITTMPETFTRQEAARRLGVSADTLRKWSVAGRGPRFSRTGDVRGRVIYTSDDLAAWLEQRKQTPVTATKGN